MASFSKIDSFSTGNKRCVIGTLTLGTYATSGEAVAASVFGLKKVTSVVCNGAFNKSDKTDTVMCTYDHTNSKMVAHRQKDPAAAGGADIALPQVANAVDLSSYSGVVTVFGF